ncbi:MAG: hypothetical protein LQ344_003181 [Seirophora lacunosa]|nr:MAG: hypothetical protein LQ344_003181 [Seirophora lacunosa]
MEGAALCGFRVGNRDQSGCLTRDDSVRLHSCENGTHCSTLQKSRNVVWITPLISRSITGDVRELGAGGGGRDLVQNHELELADSETGQRLIQLCGLHIQDEGVLRLVRRLVGDALYSRKKTIDLNLLNQSLREDAVSLDRFACLLGDVANQKESLQDSFVSVSLPLNCRPLGDSSTHLVRRMSYGIEPRLIRYQRFPYSRHSSYEEMCHLLSVIRTMDVWPCVTNEKSWATGVMIKTLFGHLSFGTSFSYDDEMRLRSDKDQDRALDCSSPSNLSGSNRHSSPAPFTGPTSAILDPASSFAASDQLQWAGTIQLDVSPGSSHPAKRQIAERASPGKRIHNITRSLQHSTAVRVDHPLCTSFSVWFKDNSDKLTPSEFLGSESAHDVEASSAGKDVTMITDAVSNRNDTLSASLDNRLPEDVRATDQKKMLAPKSIPWSSEGGDADGSTQLRPIQLLESSGSETDDNTGVGNEVRSSIPNDASMDLGSGIATQGSAGDSMLGSQDMVIRKTSPESDWRFQYRKASYEMVKRDDGYAWGRDCGLFSAATGSNDSGSEEL